MNEKLVLILFNKLFKSNYSSLDIQRDNLPEWDSMKHAELIISLQKELKIKFKIEDILNISNAQELITAISKALP